MAFQGEIDSRLPYRIGFPKLPVLPVETESYRGNIDTILPNAQHHLGNIQNILDSHNIPQYGVRFCHRVNIGAAIPERHLTLLILSRYEDGCQDEWVNAVKEIRASLVQSKVYLAIELIDERAYFNSFRTSPILSTDRDLIEGWEKVLPEFLGTIKNRNWVAIDVLNREFPSREAQQPTVVISAQDANDDIWWNTTLPALRQLFQANNLEIDVVLLFLEEIKLCTDSSNRIEPDPEIAKEFYRDPLPIGTSCAAAGSNVSGTLGGRIKLQNQSTILELGLTNYHVLKDALVDQGPSAGMFPTDQGQTCKNIVSPSDRDHESEMKRIQESLKKAEEDHRKLCERLECFTEDDPKWENANLQAMQMFYERESFKIRFKMGETASRDLGQIYAASQFRACENPRYTELMQHKGWALDWCLVKVDQPKSISCGLSSLPSTVDDVRRGAKVTQYCSISPEKNYEVMKRGRTTGWTMGTISAIDSIIRMHEDDLPEKKVPTHQRVVFKEKYGAEPVFVHGIRGTKKVPQFLQPGDSGSFILLNEDSKIAGESIVGLGFAANDACRASYMIPIDLVIEDIERVTRGKVIEPQNAGEV